MNLLDKESLTQILCSLGEHLQKQTSLSLIGSCPLILLGAPSGKSDNTPRSTIDIDCWNKYSKYDYKDLESACIKSNILFNPTDYLEPTTPYIQIVEEGVVQVPEHKPVFKFKTGNLSVYTATPQAIITSKLVRMDTSDIHDCIYLINKFKIDLEEIKNNIKLLNNKIATEEAYENLNLLIVHLNI